MKQQIIAVETADGTVYSGVDCTIHAEVILKHNLFYDNIASKGWIDQDGKYYHTGLYPNI